MDNFIIFSTGMSTKKLQEHCGKVIKVLKILKIILNHIELKVSAELVGNQVKWRKTFFFCFLFFIYLHVCITVSTSI